MWAVPEGRLVFAGEPLLEVTGPIAEAQLVETYLLNQVAFQSTLATKAARCRVASGGAVDLVDFSFRRTHGVESGLAAARCRPWSASPPPARTALADSSPRRRMTIPGWVPGGWARMSPNPLSRVNSIRPAAFAATATSRSSSPRSPSESTRVGVVAPTGEQRGE